MREPVYQLEVQPGDTPDEASVRFWEKQQQRSLHGPVVIKGDECAWQNSKMGVSKVARHIRTAKR